MEHSDSDTMGYQSLVVPYPNIGSSTDISVSTLLFCSSNVLCSTYSSLDYCNLQMHLVHCTVNFGNPLIEVPIVCYRAVLVPLNVEASLTTTFDPIHQFKQ